MKKVVSCCMQRDKGSKLWGFGEVYTFERERLQILQPSLKSRSSFTFSSTSPWFSVGLLAVWGCAKSCIFNYSFLAGRFKWAGNFEAPRKFNWASAHLPLLRISWGSPLGPWALTQEAMTGTCSTNPSLSMLEILTPKREPESSENSRTSPTAYHCSLESLIALRQSTA